MNFYSGFSLQDDKLFFNHLIDESEYNVSGFSYGAILAFKEVQKRLFEGKRVDRLQLFSPAFFQNKTTKFKKLQTLGYIKSKEIYLKSFIKQCFMPYEIKSISLKDSTLQELEELLYYRWDREELLRFREKGIKVEVYLAEKDNIIDTEDARKFFLESSTVTYVKNANHFLQTK
jgi:hypothetical protein